ncbi:MAG TPA: 16S rRNA (cytosine(1402)-N(4))-methyltransferase RsmH [Campylobacterales bacterium]|nr:16S rRNA (cytosine(1402)-N(4))-methyltransferase RsmH [Campylobacterales bacterium]HIP60461.1 16S rRNA (cytosine(1402)-N(4))-methyltransferase RsmH [Campylobacterales bacterium]
MNDLNIPHKPVLLEEVLDTFSKVKQGVIVDCTLGYGGHSQALLVANPHINMICIDQDIEALEFSKKRLERFKDRVQFLKGRFSDVINSVECPENICGILADIGVSSLQLDKSDRGFGFDSNTLDMRMDQSSELSAKEVVNNYSKEDLERIFKEYGEVSEYKKAASIIIEYRENQPFESSQELADFLAKHLYSRKLHPATLIFQAIRIEVNDELGELRRLLNSIRKLNINKSIVAIISFHSLEDRMVKTYFKEWSKSCICPREAMRCSCGNDHAFGKVVTKKPIIPTSREIDENPRSRSSKLRVFKVD